MEEEFRLDVAVAASGFRRRDMKELEEVSVILWSHLMVIS